MTAGTAKGRRRRVLLIGLDAGDAELIEKWCAEGVLPHIGAMRARGTWARMATTAEVLHVSAWPSIFTGAPPDAHGLYHAYVAKPGHQGPVRPRPEDSPVPFLWKLLSDRGRRSVIMDAFMTCPLRDFAGTQIVEWGTWSWFTEPTVIPASLGNEMRERFGPYPAEDHSKIGMVPLPDPEGFRRRLLAAVARKVEVVTWLMGREDWDLFLVVFGECHGAGHYFWHYQDPEYVAYPADASPELRSTLRDVYAALDRAIGELLSQVDEDTTVLLVAGDGMGPNYSGSHVLGHLLGRMGLLHDAQLGPAAAGADTGAAAARRRDGRHDLLSTLRGMIPRSFRATVSRTLLPRRVNERLSLRWKTAGIDWQRTRAYLIENANEGYIRLNLVGREPQGTVAPGADYEMLCDELCRTAAEMVNPATGEPAAQAVHRIDDLYQGPCRVLMPDVVINWNERACVTTELATQTYGVVRHPQPGHALAPFYTGNHRPNAFGLAVGPGIAGGATLEGAHILDLAPTLLDHFGIEIPSYMTGRVLRELMGAGPVVPAR
jgi:predicted AlkP superfamily phosphohydrolase/phosphomutase